MHSSRHRSHPFRTLRRPRTLQGFATATVVAASLVLAGCATPHRVAPTTVSFERVSNMVRIAQDEWHRWGDQVVSATPEAGACAVMSDSSCRAVDDGCGREMSAALCPVVNEYWRAILPGDRGVERHSCHRPDLCEAAYLPEDGEPELTPPWSAAFISAVMRKAGFSRSEFAFSAAHAEYVVAARDGRTSAFEVVATPTTIDVGDLVCAARTAEAEFSQMPVAAIRDHDGVTAMHCDLVVSLDLANHTAAAIGGNVQQSVSRTTLMLDADQRLSWRAAVQADWILAMKPRRDYLPTR
ncbi:MAG: uncharacterized protein JWQ11_4144 [Rhizobacter sp.]|nr:uncharacterized protein [Rhizobacter sp.]